MASSYSMLLSSSILFTLSIFLPLYSTTSDITLSSYIICTDSHSRPSYFATQEEWHHSMVRPLPDHKLESLSQSRIFYMYSVICNGFAARLTNDEASILANEPGVTSVYKDTVTNSIHTTRTPDFLGLTKNYGIWPDSMFGENIIIGLVDSGIWPESRSFNDMGLGPIPSSWKGTCEEGIEFNQSMCNKKLIGARYFGFGIAHHLLSTTTEGFGGGDDYPSPRDWYGHGTHTASTSAGAEVADANLFGFARGTARGIAPKARIAMYKACTLGGCAESDIFAAIESAIQDGVHILSLSIGGSDAAHFQNAIARGAFAAVKNNIFVACAAGNEGPGPYSVVNTAPWIATVGAGSIDRSFPVKIMLGNGLVVFGSCLCTSNITSPGTSPLVFLGNCDFTGPLPNVTGKIAICRSSKYGAFNNGFQVKAAGGVGFIQVNPLNEGEGLASVAFPLPAATVGFMEGLEILTYINNAESPTASFSLYNLTVIGKDRAPLVPGFSSRGPNPIVPQILKPDLVAPGLNILAAFAPNLPPTLSPYDPRIVNFNIISGTSMATPHVAGTAALLRSAHPDWSPAAIRSALMTTARTVDNQYRPIARFEDMHTATPLDIGAGHINPQFASDPGLIYDADVSDYINFLCSLNYTEEQLKLFTEDLSPCSGPVGLPGDLNYPSFSVIFKHDRDIQEFNRTVTNVGEMLPKIYRITIVNPGADIVTICVEPQILTFNTLGEKQIYRVNFKRNSPTPTTIVEETLFGEILWESNIHIVRSPVVIMFK